MKNDEILNLCKKIVVDYYNENVGKTHNFKIDLENV